MRGADATPRIANVMLVRVSRPDSVPELATALTRVGWPPRVVAPDAIDVAVPKDLDSRQARLELNFFLRAWTSLRAGVHAEVIE